MFQRLKENIGKGAMQRIASFNHTYFSSIASKLAICMGIKMIEFNQIYSYERIVEEMQRLHNQFHDFTKYSIIGMSHDNREIPMLTLSEGNQHLICTAGVHGRESINPVVMLKLIEDYCISYNERGIINNQFSIYHLLSDYAICFIPLMNPDGYSIALEGFDKIHNPILQSNARQLHIPYEEWKLNGRCIDINRNFASFSYNPLKPGDYAGSENETKALMHVFHTYPSIAYYDFHSRGKIIYYLRAAMGQTYNQKSYGIAKYLQGLSNYALGSMEEEFLTPTSGGNTVNYYSENFNNPAITIETVIDEAAFPMDSRYQSSTYADIRLIPIATIQYMREYNKKN